ncbi:hypothetical protein V5O48_016752 [Marasmius crinis-equi]|uniref:Uncharacterized protein n=1 Tax=Marasmius crinis-equi TaxID=585013 RepID=A0ABR3EQU4_9AGAR
MFAGHHRRSVEERAGPFAGGDGTSGGIGDLFPGHARSVEERGMPKMGGPDPGAPGGRGGPWHRSVEKRSGLFAGSDVEQRASGGIEDLFPGHARSVDKRKTDMEGDPGSPKGRGGAGKYFAGDKRDIPNVPGGDRPHGGKDPKVKGMFGQ